MRLKLLALATLGFLAFQVHATKHTITVRDFQFTPANTTIALGDTIEFSWINGEHTTTSTTIPAGAVAWDEEMTSAHTTFIYVPAVAGTYNYQCTPHASMGHVGQFTVTSGSNVQEYAKAGKNIQLFPNPAASKATLVFDQPHNATVSIVDMTGRIVLAAVSKTQEMNLDIAHLVNGTYFVRITQNGQLAVKTLSVLR
jgi:plastocyanin